LETTPFKLEGKIWHKIELAWITILSWYWQRCWTGSLYRSSNQRSELWLLEKFIFQYDLWEGGVGCIGGDCSESAVMRHSYFFDSLLYKLVGILDTDELVHPSLKVIVLIIRTGTRW